MDRRFHVIPGQARPAFIPAAPASHPGPDPGSADEAGASFTLKLLLRQPDLDLEVVTREIRSDAELTRRVLRLANSAAFARRTPAADLGEAISHIGLKNLTDLLPSPPFAA